MAEPTRENLDHLYFIAHALNDAVGDKIHELEQFKGGANPRWAQEDARDNRYELARMRDAKIFAEALVLYADKHGRLNPLEEERVMLGLSAEPHLYDHPPKLSFFVMNPREEQKVLDRYLQLSPRHDASGALATAMQKARSIPPSMWLEAFMRDTPAIADDLHAIVKPALDLRQNVTSVVGKAYAKPAVPDPARVPVGGDHIGADLLEASMYFSGNKYGHFKEKLPAEFERIYKEYRGWDDAMRNVAIGGAPLKRETLGVLARSTDIMGDVRTTIAAHAGDWPQPIEKEAKAFTRLNYVAGEVGEMMDRKFAGMVPAKRNITPAEADKPDGTSRGKTDS